MFIVIISCLLAKNANGENRDWGGDPCCNFFVVMSSRFARNFHHKCVKPKIATDSELSYRLTDETIVCSDDDVMISLRVGDSDPMTLHRSISLTHAFPAQNICVHNFDYVVQ
jgi:hypothetical protein